MTLNADGSLQVSAGWVGLDGPADEPEIVMAHMAEYLKIRNLRRDPRISLSVGSPERNGIGMQHSLVTRGRATITEGGAAELPQRLVKVYAGPDAEFPLPADPPPGFVVHIAVERISGVGPWNR